MWPFKRRKSDRVYLVLSNGEHKESVAVRRAGRWYARTHRSLPETTGELLPQGKYDGVSFARGWKPITQATVDFYNLPAIKTPNL